MPKLVAIGDSLTQGVQNGAIYNTHLSYPALIAEVMGLTVRRLGPQDSSDAPNEFRVPEFPENGLPLNIEQLLRTAHCEIGDDIDNLSEWGQLLSILPRFVQEAYDGWRSPNAEPSAHQGVYHNLAVSGFRVFDSFSVHARYCSEQIAAADRWFWDELGFLTAPMYRIAQRVLSPAQNPDRNTWTQIDNLRRLNAKEGGVENLILFLGANDCLGTVVKLDMKDMEGKRRVPDDPEERRKEYNLTSETVFKNNYTEMVNQISDVISDNTNVFVGTVPHVTIAPITNGLDQARSSSTERRYFRYYVPFFLQEENFNSWWHPELTTDDVQTIDQRIDNFNGIIRDIVNRRKNWHIVDICQLLDDLAFKRNAATDPRVHLRTFFENRRICDHPLLDEELIHSAPSTLPFESRDRQWTGGGFFSLDFFHPTTIGYGLIAEAFLQVMGEEARLPGANLTMEGRRQFWTRIINDDTLIQDPPSLWDDLVEAARENRKLSNLIYRVLTL